MKPLKISIGFKRNEKVTKHVVCESVSILTAFVILFDSFFSIIRFI